MSEHKCRCAGCTKAKKAGAIEERERIIALLKEKDYNSNHLISIIERED